MLGAVLSSSLTRPYFPCGVHRILQMRRLRLGEVSLHLFWGRAARQRAAAGSPSALQSSVPSQPGSCCAVAGGTAPPPGALRGAMITGPGAQTRRGSPVAVVWPDLGRCRPSRRNPARAGFLQLPSCCLSHFQVPTVLAMTSVQVRSCVLWEMCKETGARGRDRCC